MDGLGHFDHSELVLRRTVHISNIDNQATESDLMEVFASCGTVERVHFDKAESDPLRMAFIQFSSDHSAQQAVRMSRTTVRGSTIRVSPSRVTIDVIPPTDAVFGKPLTVGRHVMAVNPSSDRGRGVARREAAYDAASQAASEVLLSISNRTDWKIAPTEIERLRNLGSSPERGGN